MTRELMIQCINSDIDTLKGLLNRGLPTEAKIKKEMEIKTAIIEALKAEPCDDVVSRKSLLSKLDACYKEKKGIVPDNLAEGFMQVEKLIRTEPPVTPKERLCKDCIWWKDSDGVYRRGVGAESQCPINLRKVYEGNGYCCLFKPKMEGEHS